MARRIAPDVESKERTAGFRRWLKILLKPVRRRSYFSTACAAWGMDCSCGTAARSSHNNVSADMHLFYQKRSPRDMHESSIAL